MTPLVLIVPPDRTSECELLERCFAGVSDLAPGRTGHNRYVRLLITAGKKQPPRGDLEEEGKWLNGPSSPQFQPT